MNNLLANFILDNLHYIVFAVFICLIGAFILAILTFIKTNNLSKKLILNKFKAVDMFEKTTGDSQPLYTVIVSNSAISTVTISAIGFENDGNFFNYSLECQAQLEGKDKVLAIPARGSIKLKLFPSQLEGDVFKLSKGKRLKPINFYLIGVGGEFFKTKTKVIGKKMSANYVEFYAYNERAINLNFVNACQRKIDDGVKLSFFEKLRFNRLKSQLNLEQTEKPTTKLAGEQTEKPSFETTSLNKKSNGGPTAEIVSKSPETTSETAQTEQPKQTETDTND